MGKGIDLTGQSINEWFVLEKGSMHGSERYWKCKCEKCGTIEEVKGRSLREKKVMKHCLVCPICGKIFSIQKNNGRKRVRKYCYECVPALADRKRKETSYIARALKHQLVLYKGGKCEKCGYDKCEQALHFHHLNSKEKDFQLSELYNLFGCDLEKAKKEADKCILVCANCHTEIHAND